MNEHKILAELQQIDSHIDELDYREKHLPERDAYQQLAEEVAKIEGLHKTIERKLREESAVQKRHEDKLDSLNAKIEKEQTRLYSGTVTNPKELSGIQQEVAHLKEQADTTELELLEQIEVVDKLASDEKVIGERLEKRTGERDAALKTMEAVLADIRSKRALWQAKREPVYTSLSEDTRQLYDRVRAKHKLAVTVLLEGVCQGCRVDLPSTEAEHIERSTKLEKCPNCGRILVKP